MDIQITSDGIHDECGKQLTLDQLMAEFERLGVTVEREYKEHEVIRLDKSGILIRNIEFCDVIKLSMK